ncbi:MAG TPA: GDP-mannose 4,6-dehydratase, partial [Cystobacter sp.]
MSKTRVGQQSGHGGKVVIFGGAGFIGSNVADQYLSEGRQVHIFDNVSRAGVERNLRWLTDRHGALLDVTVGDIRDEQAVRRVVQGAAEV